ncbi:branched-chain amino acid ABC transporter permease [Geothrix sp. 21YS21S-2]|uniref:branched-chain amino acid ABC transporter permease n=1 Tax=Geothrix sp. 21YS21S-2 TaxID=3068893 RepID=UPI0027BB0BE1|nr:branched-chain amino acid ABC transporter permease [Geothrix sp. 21YS21S-2]
MGRIKFPIVCAAALAVSLGLQLAVDGGVFPDVLNPYYLHLLTIIGMNIILVASLNLLNGYLGEFALGHAGFMAVGAYTAALLATRVLPAAADLPPVVGPFCILVATLGGAMAAAALVGWLVGLLTFKTVGDYLAIITLGFNMIIVNAIQNLDFVGGPRGFTGIPKNTSFFAVAVCAVVTLAVLRNLIQSSFGRVWVSIRENAIAAELMGVAVNRAKNQVFTLAAAFAGLAGGLWAQNQQFITPRSFDYIKTTEILVMLYLGGMASLSGSILGVVAYTVLMEVLRNLLSAFAPQLTEWRMLISPLILILIMLTRQYGLMGNREWAWLRKAP